MTAIDNDHPCPSDIAGFFFLEDLQTIGDLRAFYHRQRRTLVIETRKLRVLESFLVSHNIHPGIDPLTDFGDDQNEDQGTEPTIEINTEQRSEENEPSQS